MRLTAIKNSLGACILAAAALPAAAGQILFYDDFVFANDNWATALAASGHTITTVSSDGDFSTEITSGGYDLVVTQFDSTGHATPSADLSAYVLGGGKAIFSHWFAEAADPAFQVTQAGLNLSTLTLSMFDSGLSGTVQALVNPTYGTFSRSFLADAGTTTAATFEDGNAGIVVGNAGNTIMNGFLGETFAQTSDEVQLYQNQLDFLLGTTSGTVPSPATLALLGLGLAGLGASVRKRKS